MNGDNLDAINESLPTLECRGLCQSSCGPIRVHQIEHERLPRRMTYTAAMRCTFLNVDGRCDVYDRRPTICRLFGMVPFMRCPHGCQPSKMLTNEEGQAILRQVAEAGGKMLPYQADIEVPGWIADAFNRRHGQ